MAQLSQKYPNDVRIVYRFFPLEGHANSKVTAQAAEAAGLQGKFFEMSEAIFAGQSEWAALSATDAENWLVAKAGELGLDKDKLRSDMNSDAVKKTVDDSLKVATNAGLPGTPFLFMNGYQFPGNLDLATLSAYVEYYKLSKRAYTACPPTVIDATKQYEATLTTDKGKIVIKLYPDKAPLAVNNFVFLAREGWYDNTTFHRVLQDFVAQGGDPSGSGFGGPGYYFKNENTSAVFDREGLVAMANSGADKNGSQFFITFSPQTSLNGGYTIFGEVTEGLDVAKSLTLRDPSSTSPQPDGSKLLKVEISEK